MRMRLEKVAAWVIIVAAVTPFFHFPFWLTITLITIGSLLWLITTKLRYNDIAVAILGGMLALAFTVPLPTKNILPAPLQLALVVGMWSTIMVLLLYLAGRFGQK